MINEAYHNSHGGPMTGTSHRLKDEAAFTLIELMIVMVVLGILAGIVMLGVTPFQNAATTSVGGANDKQCATAQSAYKAAATPKPPFSSFFDGGAVPAGCTTP